MKTFECVLSCPTDGGHHTSREVTSACHHLHRNKSYAQAGRSDSVNPFKIKEFIRRPDAEGEFL